MIAHAVPVAVLLCAFQESPAPAPGGPPEPTGPVAAADVRVADAPGADAEAAVRRTLAAYLEAFNSGDAAAVVPFWTPDAVAVDGLTGERTDGRDALRAEMADFFAANPGSVLRARLDGVRTLRPDVAEADGRTTLLTPDGAVTESNFHVVLLREGADWRIASLRETGVLATEAPEALRKLDWLLGEWETADGGTAFVVRPAPGGAFLIRTFAERAGSPGEPDGGPEAAEPAPAAASPAWAASGTQVIGWDPARGQLRSWTFHADGTFGEGWWSPAGDAWLVKSTQTLADGTTAAGTYVMTPSADGATPPSLTIGLVGLSVGGEPRPTPAAVEMRRVPDGPAAGGPESPRTVPEPDGPTE